MQANCLKIRNRYHKAGRDRAGFWMNSVRCATRGKDTIRAKTHYRDTAEVRNWTAKTAEELKNKAA